MSRSDIIIFPSDRDFPICKNMRRRIILICFFLVLGYAIRIHGRNVEQMATIADSIAHSSGWIADIRRTKTEQSCSPELLSVAYTSSATDREGNPVLAVFNFSENSEGFVIVPSDERLGDMLGYSTSGLFNYESIPCGLKWALKQFEAIMTNTGLDNYVWNIRRRITDNKNYTPIKPLISTTWDQGEPYNSFCPEEGNRRCVTGCVATSMSQIVRYIAPDKFTDGAGKVVDQSYKSVFFDFSGEPFCWSLLRDNYSNGNYSKDEADEVARLMLACGISVNMQYGVNESGAYTSLYIPYALTEYFSFSNDVFVAFREDYTASEWADIIYDELAAGRPVNYSGSSSAGGHSFICDGYDRDGLFHFNWGWSGVADGYYKLDMLNPIDQGIGGSGAFNEGQEIIGGLKKTDSKAISFPTFMNEARFVTTGTNGDIDSFSLSGYLYYMWPVESTVEFGIALRSVDGVNDTIFSSPAVSRRFDGTSIQEGIEYVDNLSYDVDMAKMCRSGATYNVFPCYRMAGSRGWRRLPLNVKGSRSLTLTVDDDGVRRYSNGMFSEDTGELLDSEFKVDNIVYRITDRIEPAVEVRSVDYLSDGDAERLQIPEHVRYLGIDFSVTAIAIDNGVFKSCNKVKHLVLPGSINQRLGMSTDWFMYLRNIRSINIPAGLTGLHASELVRCELLEKVEVDVSHPELSHRNGGIFFSSDRGETLEYVDRTSKELIVDDNVLAIGDMAGRGNTVLERVVIGDGVAVIGSSAFRDCTKLTSLTIGNGVVRLGDCVFAGCKTLNSVVFGESVCVMDTTAFSGCASLAKIRLTGAVPEVFVDDAPATAELAKYAFCDEVYSKCTLQVPEQLIREIRTVSPWRYFRSVTPVVNSIADVDTDYTIYIEGNRLIISGMTVGNLGKSVCVFSPDGVLIQTKVVSADEMIVELHRSGIFIVTIGNNCYKIIIPTH